MITDNFLRNRAGGGLSPEERAVLEGAFTETRMVPAGQIIVRQGQAVQVSTMLVEGYMTRYVDGRDGRRHLVCVHIPGDFVDLHAYALERLDHDVGALTDATIAVVPHPVLQRIQATHAHLTKRLWFATLLDAAVHRQWIFRLSSLSAIERVAHFLCEMNARLLAIGASDGRNFTLPMTQVDIGEVCSLTNVHVNRVLRQLREMELCTMKSSQIEIHDLAGLASVGQFDPQYLNLNAETGRRASGETSETL